MEKRPFVPQIYNPSPSEGDLQGSLYPQGQQQLLAMSTGAHYQDRAQHIGDNNFVPLSNLETAIEQIKRTCLEDDDLADIIKDLADYITDYPERQVIGLEEKLKRGKRADLFKRAKFLKNQFARRVAKNQMSLTEQRVYVQILAQISTTWHQSIYPKICAGSTSQQIDQIILDDLVNPVHKAIVRFDSSITTETVTGMLYFLTGKCHLVWEEEC